MTYKKHFLGILFILLVFGMSVVGCASAPSSFQRGSSGGETSILLRDGLIFEQAFREVIFVLNRHGFEPEMMQPDVGYIRSRWTYTWNDTGKTLDLYRVRILANFNPNRTQLILNAEAEFYQGKSKGWVRGFDTRAIETLRNDITQVIGN